MRISDWSSDVCSSDLAIIAEQPVCLMDEPLSNLDAQLRQEMRAEIRTLQQSLGMTMVYVTHDQAQAMSMADRVILMRQGRIEQDGRSEEHTSELQSLMRNSTAVFCLKKKKYSHIE